MKNQQYSTSNFACKLFIFFPIHWIDNKIFWEFLWEKSLHSKIIFVIKFLSLPFSNPLWLDHLTVFQSLCDLTIRKTSSNYVSHFPLVQKMFIMASMLMHDLFQLIWGWLCLMKWWKSLILSVTLKIRVRELNSHLISQGHYKFKDHFKLKYKVWCREFITKMLKFKHKKCIIHFDLVLLRHEGIQINVPSHF